ncbi:MAG: GTP-binding protein [Acidimicrobiales bacterium]
MELLRVATAGSVDDGKSTLIGRLLYDSKQVFEDHYEAIERASLQRGDDQVDLSLLTDGLRAEREQGITIDVAYRYFSTPKRKFVIADTPGHFQHTRNTVTGCSTADLVVILVDARNGITEQTCRHASIASLLGIAHLVICVNKMDLVDYDQRRFEEICAEFSKFASGLDCADVTFIPLSALQGDNVVERSVEMPWYEGTALLHHLEHVQVGSSRDLVNVRFPVQYVVRPKDGDENASRGYAGTVAGGVLRTGDEVLVLPSRRRTRVSAIETADGPVAAALPPMSVVVRLADQLDVARGDLICTPNREPYSADHVSATICWMADRPLRPGVRLELKHTTRWVQAVVSEIEDRIDVRTVERDRSAEELELNDLGRIEMRLSAPLYFDDYRRNRATGSFILVDPATAATVGAGMLTGPIV